MTRSPISGAMRSRVGEAGMRAPVTRRELYTAIDEMLAAVKEAIANDRAWTGDALPKSYTQWFAKRGIPLPRVRVPAPTRRRVA